MKTLTEQFNTISVVKGEIFAVELDGRASDGGYLWDMNVTAGNATAISRETVFTDDHPLAAGNGGLKRIFLRADEAGIVEIEAKLRRPWERGSAPLKQALFKVIVH